MQTNAASAFLAPNNKSTTNRKVMEFGLLRFASVQSKTKTPLLVLLVVVVFVHVILLLFLLLLCLL